MLEADVCRRFEALMATQPWAYRVRIPPARGKQGTALRGRTELRRVGAYRAAVSVVSADERVRLAWWRQNTAGLTAPGRGGAPRLIEAGLWGQADYVGIARPGRWVALEAKRPGGKPSAQQACYRDIVEAMGGLYLLIDDPEAGVRQLADELGVRTWC